MEKFNSRSILARLMAEEDIFVEHDNKATTASFLLKERALVLPVWKDVSDIVYIKFVGHEVGHALYTPPYEWSAAVKKSEFYEKHSISSLYWHDVLNIVEDIRIERLMKIKFPGIRRFFSLSYRELMERQFFGSPKDFGDYDFASRVNIHYKMGEDSPITFTPEDQTYLKMLDTLTDFNSVIRVSEAIALYGLS